jgi:hypothetical protein
MTDQQRLFLVQAHSDFTVFDLLKTNASLPACHALHYLQMATELLGKAHAWRQGNPGKKTHRAFVRFLRSLSTNRRAQKRLGFDGHNAQWRQIIRKSALLAKRIEDLAPALAVDGPNSEYPWPAADPLFAPAEYDFELWKELAETDGGRKFVAFVQSVFALADHFL